MIESVIEAARAKAGVANQLDFDQFGSVMAMFDHAVATYPDKPAFSSVGKTLTLRELDQLARRFTAFVQQQPQLQPRPNRRADAESDSVSGRDVWGDTGGAGCRQYQPTV